MAKKVITSQFCVTSVYDGENGERGNDGTSPWVADFDNEMDSVQCDDSGCVLEEQTVYTNVRLFHGNVATQLTIVSVKRNSTSMGNGTYKNGVTVTWGGTSSSVGISIAYKTSGTTIPKISGKDVYEIVLRSYDGESQNKTLYFTVNGVRGDVYNLLPSVDEIHATRDADGNYLINGGNTFAMTCGYSKRNLNGNVTRVTDVSARIDNKYNIYFNRHKRNGDWAGNWALYQNYKYALAMPGTTIGSNKGTLDPKTYDAIRFALCESTSNTVAVSTGLNGVIDEETVCIVSDGDKGISIALVLNRTGESGYTESNWNSWATIGVTDTASKRDYDDDFTKCRVGDYYMVVGYSYDMNIYHEATYRCTKVSSSSITGVCISHIKDGSDGDGIQYVYKRYTTEQSNLSAPTKPSSMNANGEWIPSGWTDDPTGVNSTYKFEYVSCIKRIDGVWGNFEKPALWAKYGEKGDPGDDGKDAAVVVITPNPVLFNATSDGTVAKGVYKEISVQLIVNGNKCTLSSITEISAVGMSNVIVASTSGGSSISSTSNINATSKTLYVKTSASTKSTNGAITMKVTGTYDNKTYVAIAALSVNSVFAGSTGKMFYMMGEYNSSTTYSRTSDLIPLVHYDDGVYNANLGSNGHYWYLKADSSKGNTPASGSDYWQQCDDFGVVITQGIFAKFAKLGSFVISGDWMYSQYGKIRSSSGTVSTAENSNTMWNGKPAYTYFESTDPQANSNPASGYRFAPNFAVDGLTGKAYLNNVEVKGKVTATSGSFSGTVNASSGTFNGAVYASTGHFKGGVSTPLTRINSESVAKQYGTLPTSESAFQITYIPDQIGGFQIEWGGKTYINLPSPTSLQLGREFYILNMQSAETTVRSNLVGGTAFKLYKYGMAKLKVIYDPDETNGMMEHYMWALLDCRNISKRFPTKGSINDDDTFEINHEYGHMVK